MISAHSFRSLRFILLFLVVAYILPIFTENSFAEDPNTPLVEPQIIEEAVSPPQEPNNLLPIAEWKQILQNNLISQDYQPILDAFQKVSNTPYAEEFYGKAEQTCSEFVSTHPGSDNAFWAHKILLFLQISKKDPSADLTLEQFRTNFSSHPDLVKGLREAADIYFYIGKMPSKAQALFQQILTNHPNSSESIWAQRGLVMTAVETGNYSAADTAVETLLSEYSGHPKVTTAVRVVADRYFYANDSRNAQRLYQWVNQHSPGIESIWVKRGLVGTHLRLAEYAAADETLEQLQTDYSDHPQFDAALRAAADEYFYWGHDPAKAQLLYEQILQNHPNGPECIWAQRGLVLTALEVGNKVAANAAVETLLSEYSNHPQVATAIRIVADQYFYVGNDPAKACVLYEKILRNWPDSCEKMSAQRGLAMAKVQLGEYSIGQTATETLVADFADRVELSENTGEIIDQYCSAGKSGEVIALSEKILSENPSRALELAARTGLARGYIQSGQETNAQEQINLILSSYQDEKRINYSLFVIGEEYYLLGEKQLQDTEHSRGQAALQQAIDVWQPVRAQSADTLHQAHALYYSADALRRIGAYEQAISYYQQIISQIPAYEKAWYAQLMIARCYEELAKENKVSSEDVRTAYQLVIDKYPDSSAAKIAASKLKLL